jgi:hypothetical protein
MKLTRQLNNCGHMKKKLNSFIQNQSLCVPSGRNGKKATSFVPFIEERDHLGQLINSGVGMPLKKNRINRNAVKTAGARYESKVNQ